MSRVAYVMEVPLTRRDYGRLGLAAVYAAGFSVDVIDASAFINPSLKEQPAPESETPGVSRHRISNANELGPARRVLERAAFVVMLVGYTGNPRITAIYRAVSRSRRPYVVLASNAFPGFLRFRAKGTGLVDRIRDLGARLAGGGFHPFRSILARAPKTWVRVSAPAIIVHGGRESRKLAHMFPVDDTTTVVHAHAMDYELFRLLRNERLKLTDTAVFVDEHMGFQRDLIAMGSEMPDVPDVFYPKLRAFFDRIENELGLRVVIAANPRSNYADTPDLFGDRRVVRGETPRLVAESKLVLGHRSTALGFAFLFRRPICLIATRRMYHHWSQKPAMDAFAKLLNKPVLFFDEPGEAELTDAFRIDEDAYDSYIADYVKIPTSADRPYWDIVLDAVQTRISA